MGKLTLDIHTASFQQNETKNKQLSILLGMGSLVYTLSDLPTSQAELFRKWEFQTEGTNPSDSHPEFTELFNSDPLFDKTFSNTAIGFKTKAFTLVPERLYNEAAKATYLTAVEELSPGDKLLHDHLPALNAHVVYAVDPDIFNLFATKFKAANFYHSMSALLCGVKQIHMQHPSSAVYFHVLGRHIDLVYFKGEQLHFCNTFEFKTASDCLYYLLLVYDQFQLSQETIPLYILGEMIEASKIYGLLFRYVKNISIIRDIPFVRFETAQSNIISQYINNFSLLVCPK